jgi:hypothetical protein
MYTQYYEVVFAIDLTRNRRAKIEKDRERDMETHHHDGWQDN